MDENKMKKPTEITCLFLDIGGVLLTDGWDHASRRLAAKDFNLDWAEMEVRHQLNFATYEEGKLKLEQYLNRTIFHEARQFTKDQFWDFMLSQSYPYLEMIALVRRLKAKYGLKVIVVSNEARELNAYRIQKFKLNEFVDCFISSCFIRLRKPDEDFFRLALDISQTPPQQIVYIENTALFIDIAESFGIKGILHTDYVNTCTMLSELGLHAEEDINHKKSTISV